MHLSQGDLAARIGCSQTAISQLEAGNLNVLSNQKLKMLCAELGLTLSSTHILENILCYCTNFDCPNAFRMVVNGKLAIQPAMYRIPVGGTRFCKGCGSPLAPTCLEPSCQAPPEEGSSFCTHCGTPLVKIDESRQSGDLHDLAERMNRYNRERLEMAKDIEMLSPNPRDNASPFRINRKSE